MASASASINQSASICKNEEARISAQAYVKFYENESGIQYLQEIPDLINKVDQILNDRLNNLQEEDHSMLSENLRKRIVEELNVRTLLFGLMSSKIKKFCHSGLHCKL